MTMITCTKAGCRRRETSNNLPLELEKEIFSYLPSQSVIRLRRVCKRWNTHTRHHTFTYLHLSKLPHTQSTINPQFAIETKIKGKPSFAIGRLRRGKLETTTLLPRNFSPEHDVHLVCSCNGLLCFVESKTNSLKTIYLCNPLLQESYKLPELGEHDTNVLGVGFDPVMKEYKVLNSVCRLIDEEVTCFVHFVMICTVSMVDGRITKWRELGVRPDMGFEFTPPVFLDGRLHWCGLTIKKQSSDFFSSDLNEVVPKIISFDSQSEKFHEWSLEKLNFHYRKEFLALGEVQGCLALLLEERQERGGCVSIWTTKEYDSWSLKFTVDLTFRSISAGNPMIEAEPLYCYGTSDHKFWVCYENHIVCYTSGFGKCAVFRELPSIRAVSRYFTNRVHVTPFVGSLVSLKP